MNSHKQLCKVSFRGSLSDKVLLLLTSLVICTMHYSRSFHLESLLYSSILHLKSICQLAAFSANFSKFVWKKRTPFLL